MLWIFLLVWWPVLVVVKATTGVWQHRQKTYAKFWMALKSERDHKTIKPSNKDLSPPHSFVSADRKVA